MARGYTYEFYPLELFKEAIAGERRHVFVCLSNGKCRVEDKYPEFGKLLSLFEEKCQKGFEVVQVLFQDRGVLVLYKKSELQGE